MSVHVLTIFKITPLINETFQKFSVLHNHHFYVQHFCSYLTENMTGVNFKKSKSLIYLGKFYTGVRIITNTAIRGKVQRLQMLQ